MRSLIFVSVLLSALLAMSCAKQLPVVLNFNQEPIPARTDGNPYSLDEVQQAILTACRHKGWAASVVEPGRIEGSITIRSRHRAKIEIPFTTTHYSILYKESSGLEYGNGHIHSNYNHWVAKLDAEIKRVFGLRTQRY